MTNKNKQPNVTLNVPTILRPAPPRGLRTIKWCEGHWAELMFALQDRGVADQIAPSPEELNAKFVRGETDPCWDVCNMVNVGALEIFGPNKVLDENDGCPVCAFANMIQHAADVVAVKYVGTH